MIPDFAEMYGIEATSELVHELRTATRPASICSTEHRDPDQVRELVRTLTSELGGRPGLRRPARGGIGDAVRARR
jgi:hypothetical protein